MVGGNKVHHIKQTNKQKLDGISLITRWVRKISSLEVEGNLSVLYFGGGGIFTENLHYSPSQAWLKKPYAEKSAYSGPQPDLIRHKFSVEACVQDSPH